MCTLGFFKAGSWSRQQLSNLGLFLAVPLVWHNLKRLLGQSIQVMMENSIWHAFLLIDTNDVQGFIFIIT